MNKLIVIGNLTRDPQSRTVASGDTVCSFTIAVNRRQSSQNQNQPSADFFRVSAWRKLGEVCQQYLAKGRKVCIIGSVSVSSYEAKDGSMRFSLDVQADDIEFLMPKGQTGEEEPANRYDEQIDDDDDLPF